MDWEAENKSRTKRFWLGVFVGFLAAVFIFAGVWCVWQISTRMLRGNFTSGNISEQDVEDKLDQIIIADPDITKEQSDVLYKKIFDKVKYIEWVPKVDFTKSLTKEEMERLMMYIHKDVPECSERTFKSRLKMCLEFIKIYGMDQKRNWNLENPNVELVICLYQIFYIDKIKYKRREALAWAKDFMQLLESKYEKDELNDGERQTKLGLLQEAHYVLGTLISIKLMEIQPNGEKINFVKYRIWSIVNQIAVQTFLAFCPGIDGNDYSDSFNKTRDIFEKIYKEIYN